jgi:hypothetical protein
MLYRLNLESTVNNSDNVSILRNPRGAWILCRLESPSTHWLLHHFYLSIILLLTLVTTRVLDTAIDVRLTTTIYWYVNPDANQFLDPTVYCSTTTIYLPVIEYRRIGCYSLGICLGAALSSLKLKPGQQHCQCAQNLFSQGGVRSSAWSVIQ